MFKGRIANGEFKHDFFSLSFDFLVKKFDLYKNVLYLIRYISLNYFQSCSTKIKF